MGESRRFAVISARHNPNDPAIPIADCKRIFETGQHSIVGYWAKQTNNWFSFPNVGYFGPVDVQLPPPPHARSDIFNIVRQAAEAQGANLSGFDNFVVFLTPGRAEIPNPNGPVPPTVTQGYDAGANGLGAGSVAVLVAFETLTFFCHEAGHLLGFDHSWGILNHGVDWAGTGATSNVYGDPYDIMSAQTFGESDPRFQLPLAEQVAGFAASRVAGPGLARALLHFQAPLSLETTGAVRHQNASEDAYMLIKPAGSVRDGIPELLAWHPVGEDEAGRGRVYVEYRHYGEFDFGTFWDQGLATAGDNKTRTGLIIHTVKNATGTNSPVIWYAGRIVFPAVDTDVVVDTALGPISVSISDDTADQDAPVNVRVKVLSPRQPRLWLSTEVTDTKTVISSELRIAPGFAFMGPFHWEKRSVLRKMKIVPKTAGLGLAPFDVGDTTQFNWAVDGVSLDFSKTSWAFEPNGKAVTLDYKVDPIRRSLVIQSRPADGEYTVGLRASVTDTATPQPPLVAQETFIAPPIEEGWGEDYQAFLKYWDRITHPIPLPHIGPPDPRPIEDLNRYIDIVHGLNPNAARAMQQMAREIGRSQSVVRGQPVFEFPHGIPHLSAIQRFVR